MNHRHEGSLTNRDPSTDSRLPQTAQDLPKLFPVERLVGANINPETFLATDYLNHFTEAVMILDLVADMPDCLDDLKDWRPLTYKEHFQVSHFPYKTLAIAAYDHANPDRRQELEEIAATMNAIILATVQEHSNGVQSPNPDVTEKLRALVSKASGIINGAPLKSTAKPEDTEILSRDMSQDAVDSLFD